MKGFDDHLDNYGDPDPGDDFDYDPDPYAGVPEDVDPDYTDPSFYDDGITTDDFDHWPGGREFPS